MMAVFVMSTATSAGKTEDTHFDYGHQADWSEIHGDRQSPVALDSHTAIPDLDDDDDDNIRIFGKAKDAVVVDNSHTIQVNVLPGNFATIRERRFQLLQFHFHTPGEHTLNGKRYPLEGHFVYRAKDGRLAVIAVMFDEGAANPAFDAIMQRVVRGGQGAPLSEFDISKLFPVNLSYYHYLGSLTTPPLSQNVEWDVLSQPITLSAAQIEEFHRYYTHNNRDLQPLNGREVLYYSESSK